MKHLIRILATLALLSAPCHAQVDGAPSLIDYQGRLLNAAGGALEANANVQIHFRIWDSQTDTGQANLLWSEKQIVTVVDGNFSVRLGEGEVLDLDTNDDPLPVTGAVDLTTIFGGEERYLGITVIRSGEAPAEIQPRLRFLTVPFAMVAETAKEVQPGGITTGQIGVGAITLNLLASDSVDSSRIVDGGIQASDISDNEITASQLAPNSVGASELDTGNLQDSIQAADLAPGSVTSSEILDGSVTSSKIADNTIRVDDLAPSIGVWEKSGSNVHYLDGDVGVGTSTPQVPLQIEGGSDASTSGKTSGFLTIGDPDGANMVFDSNEIITRFNGFTSSLFLNPDGGAVTAGGNFRCDALYVDSVPSGDYNNVQWNSADQRFYYDNSSRRYKENIKPLEADFELLLEAEPKTYTRPGRPDRWEIGFIAEEFDELGLGKLVYYEADETTPEGLNYEKMTIYLTEIVKGQKKEIREMRDESRELRERLRRLEAALDVPSDTIGSE